MWLLKELVLSLEIFFFFFVVCCPTIQPHRNTRNYYYVSAKRGQKRILHVILNIVLQMLLLKNGLNMSPSRHPFPRVFSRCSKRDLDSYFQKGGGMCLYNMPNMKDLVGGKKCGNGFVEEGEECDCGEPDVSTSSSDSCLNPGTVSSN